MAFFALIGGLVVAAFLAIGVVTYFAPSDTKEEK